eukprot:jgi/Mesen1/1767/ME000014S01174
MAAVAVHTNSALLVRTLHGDHHKNLATPSQSCSVQSIMGRRPFPTKICKQSSGIQSERVKHALRKSSPQRVINSRPVVQMMGFGHMSQGYTEDDAAYVNASILEAMEVELRSDGFVMKMRDGRYIKCDHVQPDGSKVAEYDAQHAIVLKMEDTSGILLPIIVAELPSMMLMEAVKNVAGSRPTVYQVIRDMVDVMGYQVKKVRITHRETTAYYARIYLAKVGDDTEALVSLDVKPSDAINLAVRANVPVQVNKALALGDGIRVVGTTILPPRGGGARTHMGGGTFRAAAQPAATPSSPSAGNFSFLRQNPDRGTPLPCKLAIEFDLVRAMTTAAWEERYVDAAKLRDQLNQIRGKQTYQI